MAVNEVVIRVRAKDDASGPIGGIGRKITGALKLPAIAAAGAVLAIGVGAIKMAADFDKAFGEVTTLFDAPKDQVQALRTGVKNLAKEMGLDATEATKALYQAISAGVAPGNAIDFLRENAKLAIGGVTDLNTAVDLTTTVLNAFGLEQKELTSVSDAMFTAVRLGKTTIDELGAALFNVAPVAAQMGVSVDEVSAALAVMTAKGVPTSVATTQLRQAILALAAPTKRQAKELKELGLSFDADTIAAQGLAETFRQLIEAADGDDEVLRRLVGSTEALQAVLALGADDAKEFEAALAQMGQKSGATDAAFTKMNKTFDRQFQLLKAQLKGILLDIGEKVLPLLIDALERLNPWLQEKIPQAIEFMGAKWEEFQPKLEQFVAFMQESVIPVIQEIIAIVEQNWPKISAVIKLVMEEALRQVRLALNPVITLFEVVSALLRGEWGEAWRKLKEGVIEQMELMWRGVTLRLDLIKVVFGDVFRGIANNAIGAIETAMRTVIRTLARGAREAGELLNFLPGNPGQGIIDLADVVLNNPVSLPRVPGARPIPNPNVFPPIGGQGPGAIPITQNIFIEKFVSEGDPIEALQSLGIPTP